MHNKPIKSLGQHFLIDKNIAEKIVNSLKVEEIDNISPFHRFSYPV